MRQREEGSEEIGAKEYNLLVRVNKLEILWIA
jgi:hypothetical protein